MRFPCFMGVDIGSTKQLVAAGRSVDEVGRFIGADSLAYLSLEGVYEAIRSGRETHCDACFTGEYPLDGTDGGANGKFALEHELPLMRA